jgi:hypothetical protein
MQWWINAVLAMAQFQSIWRSVGIVVAVLLMLLAIVFGSMATLLLGVGIFIASAFWPTSKTPAEPQ